MLVLKSLTFSGIGRFVEEQSIDFTQLGSLVQIDGQNNCTGGSSGAGKSTIFKALEFLLGLNDLSITVLQSRLTKDPMTVTGLFELDGTPLKIERGKKLLIDLNGEVTTGSSKLSEEKLDQILGMPRDLFRKILHKRQGEGGFFLDMGPTDVHKFLTNCLGLEAEQVKVVKLDEILKTLLEHQTSLESTVASNLMALEASRKAKESLGPPPISRIDSATIQGAVENYFRARDNHKLVVMDHKREVEEFEKSRPQISTVPFDRSNIERLEAEVGTLLAQVSVLEKLELDRQSEVKTKINSLQIDINDKNNAELLRQSEVKNQISFLKEDISELQKAEEIRRAKVQSDLTLNSLSLLRAKAESVDGGRAKVAATNLAQELQKVRSSLCPTCEQGWINDAAKTKEADILQKLQECKKTVIAGMAADKEILALEEERNRLNNEFTSRSIPEVDGIKDKISKLEIDSKAKPIPGLEAIKAKFVQLQQESESQAIPEAIEIKLKVDFKNKELFAHRREERDHSFKENTANNAIIGHFDKRRTELRLKHESMVKILRDSENQALYELETAKSSLKAFEAAKQNYDASLLKLEEQALTYHETYTVKSEDLARVKEEIELAGEAKKAIKSYLSASFEDALDSIGDAATRFIRNIPNMSTATIRFEGLKEAASTGKIREEVVCIISVDGEPAVPIKSLSGGERSSIDLSVDLAVVSAIEEKTGKGSNLYIMDEPFQYLDSVNIQQILEMINELRVSKSIILVDHNPIIKEMVGERIVVLRDGEVSRILHEKNYKVE